MSLQTFKKNLNYLKKKRGLTQSEIVKAVNKILRREFNVSEDKEINMKRLGSYMEGRAYCPAYILPALLKVLGHKDAMSIFTDDLEAKATGAKVSCEKF